LAAEYLGCVQRILELDPEVLGKQQCMQFALTELSRLWKRDQVQIIEVLDHSREQTTFLKHYIGQEPHEFIAKTGVNHFCVLRKKYILLTNVDKRNQVAAGLQGSIADLGNASLPEPVSLPYIHVPPSADEDSVIFYPLIRNEKCIGTLKLCDFSSAEPLSLEDVRMIRPVADALSGLIYFIQTIERLSAANERLDTLSRESRDAVEKSKVSTRLAFQFLNATSHLHELASLLGGMAADRLEISAILQRTQVPGAVASKIEGVLDRYDAHRSETSKRLRKLLDARPDAVTLSPKRQNVKTVIDQQLQLYTARLDQEGISLQKSLKAADVDIEIDGSTLAYVIRILLNNAMHATRVQPARSRRIGTYAAIEDACLVIRVKDNGSGVPREFQPRIFEAFFTTKTDGNGIGLYWARSILERQGGSLELERSFDFAGSVFKISLPLEGDATNAASS
jgi:signal transduction histidine kinase